MSNLKNIKGWYISNNTFSIIESASDKTKDVYAQGLLLPKDQISRNGVLYDWNSIVNHHKELVGLPMMYNHELNGTPRPVGTFTDSWLKEFDDNEGIAGWYYKSKLNPRSEFFDDILEGFVNKVSIQVNANEVVSEYKNGKEYERAFIDEVIEGSAVPCPGFMQTSIETLIAEGMKKVKTEEYFRENTDFPYDIFKNGLEQELGEHPKVSTLDAAQLVLDHLKEDINYYSDNSDKETKKEEITTATASGAMAPTTLGSNDNKEDDKMSKEDIIKKESETPEDKKDEDKKDEETDKKLEESVDEDKKDDVDEDKKDDEKKLSESIKKEEYEVDMSNITSVLEKFNTELSSLRAEISDLKSKILSSEESVDTDSEDTGVAPEDQTNADNIVTPVSENNEEPEEKSDKDDEVEEPIPPKLESTKVTGLKETVDIDVEPELSGKEALRKYMKERLNL